MDLTDNLTYGARDCWRTPRWLFNEINDWFGFDLDAAADETNSLTTDYFGPGGIVASAFMARPSMLEDRTIWCNPPFSKVGRFAEWLAKQEGNRAVMLAPGNRGEQDWWHRYVIGKARKVSYIRKRVQYDPPPGVEPSTVMFGSVLIFYGPTRCAATIIGSYKSTGV